MRSLTLLCVLLASNLGAQEYRFQLHAAEQGLMNLAVKGLYQDRTGFLWVSTENGIFRYDGERFQSFGREEGLPALPAAAFAEAPDGSLLIGADAGLYRAVGKRFEKVPLPGATSVNWMGGLKSDAWGHIYAATDNGLMILTGTPLTADSSVRRVAAPAGVDGSSARGIFVEKDAVWYGCGDQICRLSGERVTGYGRQEGLPPAPWVVIGRSANGDLWVRGRGPGIEVLPPGASAFIGQEGPLPSAGLSGVPAVDSNGRVLFPSPNGLVIYDNGVWTNVGRASGLRGAVYSVMQDREGSVWIGTAGRGLARWVGYNEWEAYTAESGLGTDVVYEILPRPDGVIWAGTEAGLLRGTRHGQTLAWERLPAVGNTPVHSLRFDSDGDLWLGTETRGVARLHPASGAVTWIGDAEGLDAKSPYTLHIDGKHQLWAATENGLYLADLPFRRFHRVAELPNVRFWGVIETRNGEIWAGGANGLYRFANGWWERFTSRDGLSNDEVLSLRAGPEGDVWVGYRFGGEIDRVAADQKKVSIRHMAHKQAGGAGLVYFLGFDARQRLWAGTEHGVDVWEAGRWSHMDSNDGLVWDDCDLNGFAAESDGTVWIGTSGGLARFSPHPRPPSNYKSAIVFTRLSLGKRDSAATDHPQVDYRSNELIARYSALTFSGANALSFRYRLSPLFAEWRTTDRTELDFPGLPSGSWRLEVQVRDQSGKWSGETAGFDFRIQPPWFRSLWFLVLCAALLVALLALGFKWRESAARRREEELLSLVEERTLDLKKANNELFRLSSTDSLTGVANRRTLDVVLEREWARLARSSEMLSVLLLDVDHFKALNDSEGHQRGDECLVLLASELRRRMKRATDLVARYGGEEFAIVLPCTDGTTAMHFAENLRQSIAQIGMRNAHSPVAPTVTVSIGVTTAACGSFADVAELLAAADQALYAAKNNGRNRVEYFGPLKSRAEHEQELVRQDLLRVDEACRPRVPVE